MKLRDCMLFILICCNLDSLSFSAESENKTIINCKSNSQSNNKIKEVDLTVVGTSLLSALGSSEQSPGKELKIGIKVNGNDNGNIKFNVESGFEPGMYKAIGSMNFHETVIIDYDRWAIPSLTVSIISGNSKFFGDLCKRISN